MDGTVTRSCDSEGVGPPGENGGPRVPARSPLGRGKAMSEYNPTAVNGCGSWNSDANTDGFGIKTGSSRSQLTAAIEETRKESRLRKAQRRIERENAARAAVAGGRDE